MSRIRYGGKPLAGENSAFLKRLQQAFEAAGATRVNVISGYRSPEYNRQIGGASSSNHTRGLAVDATAFIPGKGWVPGGDVPTLKQYGLRSGDQPGFFHGQPDPNHVDAGYMAQGAPAAAPTADSSGYFTQALQQLGVKPTPASIAFLNQWAHREGVPQNVDANNLLGTTLSMGGSHGTNGPGVQSYPDMQTGVKATAAMLGQGNFTNIRQALASGNPQQYAGDPQVQAEFRSWSGGGYSWPTAGSSQPLSVGGSKSGAPAPAASSSAARPQASPNVGANSRAFANTLLAATRSNGGLTPAALLTALRASTAHMRAGAV